eukprot:GHVN01012099.1.p1 GENE.GHVN01012099.1~~GHVN01012099.1.p1  ORF type:complete len:416 (+),score=56.80 GHVN01012099.1:123-1370(+)
MGERELDLVIFGATGFTGKLVSLYLAQNYLAPKNGEVVKFALAGRSLAKLEEVRAELEAVQPGAARLELIAASVDDERSLTDMCARTKVVITTVGPFLKHGEALVKACISAGTHYCDITGEHPYVRTIIDKYHDKAVEKKLKIVNCCGFDSIPSDLGVYILQQRVKNETGAPLTQVNCRYMDILGGVSGGTIASMMQILSLPQKTIKASEDPHYLCGNQSNTHTKQVAQPDPSGWQYDSELGSYSAPFVMEAVNSRIVRRSNFLLNHEYGENFKYHEAMGGFQNWPVAFLMCWSHFVLMKLMTFSAFRKVAAMVLPKQGDGPSLKTRNKGYFKAQLYGTKLVGDKKQVFKAHVASYQGDPGYAETSKMLTESGLCTVLTDQSTPQRYGVLTPSSAFGMTLVNRLKAKGMEFDAEG